MEDIFDNKPSKDIFVNSDIGKDFILRDEGYVPEDRGIARDIAHGFASGLLRHVAGIGKTIDVSQEATGVNDEDNPLTKWADRTKQKYDIFKPDKPEYFGEDSALRKGIISAADSIGMMAPAIATGAALTYVGAPALLAVDMPAILNATVYGGDRAYDAAKEYDDKYKGTPNYNEADKWNYVGLQALEAGGIEYLQDRIFLSVPNAGSLVRRKVPLFNKLLPADKTFSTTVKDMVNYGWREGLADTAKTGAEELITEEVQNNLDEFFQEKYGIKFAGDYLNASKDAIIPTLLVSTLLGGGTAGFRAHTQNKVIDILENPSKYTTDDLSNAINIVGEQLKTVPIYTKEGELVKGNNEDLANIWKEATANLLIVNNGYKPGKIDDKIGSKLDTDLITANLDTKMQDVLALKDSLGKDMKGVQLLPPAIHYGILKTTQDKANVILENDSKQTQPTDYTEKFKEDENGVYRSIDDPNVTLELYSVDDEGNTLFKKYDNKGNTTLVEAHGVEEDGEKYFTVDTTRKAAFTFDIEDDIVKKYPELKSEPVVATTAPVEATIPQNTLSTEDVVKTSKITDTPQPPNKSVQEDLENGDIDSAQEKIDEFLGNQNLKTNTVIKTKLKDGKGYVIAKTDNGSGSTTVSLIIDNRLINKRSFNDRTDAVKFVDTLIQVPSTQLKEHLSYNSSNPTRSMNNEEVLSVLGNTATNTEAPPTVEEQLAESNKDKTPVKQPVEEKVSNTEPAEPATLVSKPVTTNEEQSTNVEMPPTVEEQISSEPLQPVSKTSKEENPATVIPLKNGNENDYIEVVQDKATDNYNVTVYRKGKKTNTIAKKTQEDVDAFIESVISRAKPKAESKPASKNTQKTEGKTGQPKEETESKPEQPKEEPVSKPVKEEVVEVKEKPPVEQKPTEKEEQPGKEKTPVEQKPTTEKKGNQKVTTEEVTNAYKNNNNINSLSKELGVSPSTVRRHLKKAGISLKGKKKQAKSEPKKTAPEKTPVFGENNTVFTRAMFEKTIKEINKSLNELRSGVDPTVAAKGMQVIGYYVEGGFRKFGDVVKKMVSDFPPIAKLKHNFKDWYKSVRDYSGFDNTGMSSNTEIDAFIESNDFKTLGETTPEPTTEVSEPAPEEQYVPEDDYAPQIEEEDWSEEVYPDAEDYYSDIPNYEDTLPPPDQRPSYTEEHEFSDVPEEVQQLDTVKVSDLPEQTKEQAKNLNSSFIRFTTDFIYAINTAFKIEGTPYTVYSKSPAKAYTQKGLALFLKIVDINAVKRIMADNNIDSKGFSDEKVLTYYKKNLEKSNPEAIIEINIPYYNYTTKGIPVIVSNSGATYSIPSYVKFESGFHVMLRLLSKNNKIESNTRTKLADLISDPTEKNLADATILLWRLIQKSEDTAVIEEIITAAGKVLNDTYFSVEKLYKSMLDGKVSSATVFNDVFAYVVKVMKEKKIPFVELIHAMSNVERISFYDILLEDMKYNALGKVSPINNLARALNSGDVDTAINLFQRSLRSRISDLDPYSSDKPIASLQSLNSVKLISPHIFYRATGERLLPQFEVAEVKAINRLLAKAEPYTGIHISTIGVSEGKATKFTQTADGRHVILNMYQNDVNKNVPAGELRHKGRPIYPVSQAFSVKAAEDAKVKPQNPFVRSEREDESLKSGLYLPNYAVNLVTKFVDTADVFEDQIVVSEDLSKLFIRAVKNVIGTEKDIKELQKHSGKRGKAVQDIIKNLPSIAGVTIDSNADMVVVKGIETVIENNNSPDIVTTKIMTIIKASVSTKITTRYGSKGTITFATKEELGTITRPKSVSELLLEALTSKEAKDYAKKYGVFPFLNNTSKAYEDEYKKARESIGKDLGFKGGLKELLKVLKSKVKETTVTEPIQAQISITGVSKRLNTPAEIAEAMFGSVSGGTDIVIPTDGESQVSLYKQINSIAKDLGYASEEVQGGVLHFKSRISDAFGDNEGIVGVKSFVFTGDKNEFSSWDENAIMGGQEGAKFNPAGLSAYLYRYGAQSESGRLILKRMVGNKRAKRVANEWLKIWNNDTTAVSTATSLKSIRPITNAAKPARTILDKKTVPLGSAIPLPGIHINPTTGVLTINKEGEYLYLPTIDLFDTYVDSTTGIVYPTRITKIYSTLIENLNKLNNRDYEKITEVDSDFLKTELVRLIRTSLTGISDRISMRETTQEDVDYIKYLDSALNAYAKKFPKSQIAIDYKMYKDDISYLIKSLQQKKKYIDQQPIIQLRGMLTGSVPKNLVINNLYSKKEISKLQYNSTKLNIPKDSVDYISLSFINPSLKYGWDSAIRQAYKVNTNTLSNTRIMDIKTSAYKLLLEGKGDQIPIEIRRVLIRNLKQISGAFKDISKKGFVNVLEETWLTEFAKSYGLPVEPQALEHYKIITNIYTNKNAIIDTSFNEILGKDKSVDILQERIMPGITGGSHAAVVDKTHDLRQAIKILKQYGIDTADLQAVFEEHAAGVNSAKKNPSKAVLTESQVGVTEKDFDTLSRLKGRQGVLFGDLIRYPTTGGHSIMPAKVIMVPMLAPETGKQAKSVAIPGMPVDYNYEKNNKVISALNKRIESLVEQRRKSWDDTKKLKKLNKEINDLMKVVYLITPKYKAAPLNLDFDGDPAYIIPIYSKKEAIAVIEMFKFGQLKGNISPIAWMHLDVYEEAFNTKRDISAVEKNYFQRRGFNTEEISIIGQTYNLSELPVKIKHKLLLQVDSKFDPVEILRLSGIPKPTQENIDNIISDEFERTIKDGSLQKTFTKPFLGLSTETWNIVSRIAEGMYGLGNIKSSYDTSRILRGTLPDGKSEGSYGQSRMHMLSALAYYFINAGMKTKHGGVPVYTYLHPAIMNGTIMDEIYTGKFQGVKGQVENAHRAIRFNLDALNNEEFAQEASLFLGETYGLLKEKNKDRKYITDILVKKLGFEGLFNEIRSAVIIEFARSNKLDTKKAVKKIETLIKKDRFRLQSIMREVVPSYLARTSTAAAKKFYGDSLIAKLGVGSDVSAIALQSVKGGSIQAKPYITYAPYTGIKFKPKASIIEKSDVVDNVITEINKTYPGEEWQVESIPMNDGVTWYSITSQSGRMQGVVATIYGNEQDLKDKGLQTVTKARNGVLTNPTKSSVTIQQTAQGKIKTIEDMAEPIIVDDSRVNEDTASVFRTTTNKSTVSAVETIVSETLGKKVINNGSVVVVSDPDELVKICKADLSGFNVSNIGGLYYEGVVYLVASNLDTGDVARVATHEVLHHLVDNDTKFKETYNLLLSKFKELNTVESAGAWRKARENNPGLSDTDLEEEAFAYYLQDNISDTKQGFFRRLIAAFKAFLNRIGVKIDISPDDMASIITGRFKYYQEAISLTNPTFERMLYKSGNIIPLEAPQMSATLFTQVKGYNESNSKPKASIVENTLNLGKALIERNSIAGKIVTDDMDNLEKTLLPIYIKKDRASFKIAYEAFDAYVLEKDRLFSGFDSILNGNNNAFLRMSNEYKTSKAFGDLVVALDKEDTSGSLTKRDQENSVGSFELGDTALELLYTVASTYNLNAKEILLVKEAYENYLKANYASYNESINSLKNVLPADKFNSIVENLTFNKYFFPHRRSNGNVGVEVSSGETGETVSYNTFQVTLLNKFDSPVDQYINSFLEVAKDKLVRIEGNVSNDGVYIRNGKILNEDEIEPNYVAEYDGEKVEEIRPDYIITVSKLKQSKSNTDTVSEVVSKFTELYNSVEDSNTLPPTIEKQLKEALVQDLVAALQSYSGLRGRGKKVVTGYDTSNPIEVILTNYRSVSNMIAHNNLLDKTRKAIAAVPEQNTTEKEALNRYIIDLLRDNNKVEKGINKINAVAFFAHLAGNFSSPLLNLTSLVTTTVPYLSMIHNKYSVSGMKSVYSKLMKNVKIAFKVLKYANVHGLSLRDDKVLSNKKYIGVIIEETGLLPIQITLLNYLLESNSGRAILTEAILGNYMGGNESTLQRIKNYLSIPFAASEVVNRMATFLTAADMFLQEENPELYNKVYSNSATVADVKEALDYVSEHSAEVVNLTQGNYNKNNYPLLLTGGTTIRSLGKAGYIFQHYTNSYLQMLGNAVFGKTKNKNGWKMMLHSLGTIVLLGGVSALPIAAVLINAISKATGDDPEKWVESVLGEDAKDIVLYGLPYEFGLDLSGKMQVGLPFLNSFNRTSDGATSYIVKNIAPVPASMLDAGVETIDLLWNQKQYYRAVEKMAPYLGSALAKNVMQSYRLATDGGTTLSGRKRVDEDGNEVIYDMYDALLKSVGFSPVSWSKYWRRKNAIYNKESYYTGRKSVIYRRAREAKGNKEQLKKIWLDVVDYNYDLLNNNVDDRKFIRKHRITHQKFRNAISGNVEQY